MFFGQVWVKVWAIVGVGVRVEVSVTEVGEEKARVDDVVTQENARARARARARTMVGVNDRDLLWFGWACCAEVKVMIGVSGTGCVCTWGATKPREEMIRTPRTDKYEENKV